MERDHAVTATIDRLFQVMFNSGAGLAHGIEPLEGSDFGAAASEAALWSRPRGLAKPGPGTLPSAARPPSIGVAARKENVARLRARPSLAAIRRSGSRAPLEQPHPQALPAHLRPRLVPTSP